MTTQNQSGRGSNLTNEDRRKGSEHSHGGSSKQVSKQGQGSNSDRQRRLS